MANGMSMHHRRVESLKTVLRVHALNGDKGITLEGVFDEADKVYDWINETPTERRARKGNGKAGGGGS